MPDWEIIFAGVATAVSLFTLLTSASRARVQTLMSIIEAQAGRIDDLEDEVAALKAERRWLRRILRAEQIDPDCYVLEEAVGDADERIV
jgi:hypothetical protein